ncbi:hypothetical protein [Pseudomonas hygromyciniae]|uniref:hypothetical protein n=1 Tax=Pseudomonas hygromyciniae TaxID=2812000 RepID=UPI00288058D7|nr:hypothetical protein [Pseudomonas hygromyciniae]
MSWAINCVSLNLKASAIASPHVSMALPTPRSPRHYRQENGLKEAANINVIAVADTDLLTDRLWLQEQQRSGHSLLRPWADNDAFVINSLDYLSGSEALVSLRARGRFSRLFSVVDELQRQAQIRFQSTYRQLSQSLAETDRASKAAQQS